VSRSASTRASRFDVGLPTPILDTFAPDSIATRLTVTLGITHLGCGEFDTDWERVPEAEGLAGPVAGAAGRGRGRSPTRRRSGLVKRFESSARAFAVTCRRMADSHDAFLTLLDQGFVATGQNARERASTDVDELDQLAAPSTGMRTACIGRGLRRRSPAVTTCAATGTCCERSPPRRTPSRRTRTRSWPPPSRSWPPSPPKPSSSELVPTPPPAPLFQTPAAVVAADGQPSCASDLRKPSPRPPQVETR
jgi:hypothetical protein